MTEVLISAMAAVAVGAAARTLLPRFLRTVGAVSGHNLGDSVVRTLSSLGARLPGNRSRLRPNDWPADAVIGARFVLAFAGLSVGLIAGPMAWLLAPIAGIAGYASPDLWLRAKRRADAEEVEAVLPEITDMVSVCLLAGLNVQLALERVAPHVKGILGNELRRALRDIEMGIPRARALEDAAGRLTVDGVTSLFDVLAGAERFGSRVSESLSDLASDLRIGRKRGAEENARRAPVKMLFPLVFLILPAFILLTVVPVLVNTFDALRF